MSKVLFDKDFKDPAVLAKFAKDYWQIREDKADLDQVFDIK